VIASGGIVRVLNGCEVRHGRVVQARSPSNGRALFQAVEYLRAFLGGRLAWSHLNSLLVISGAFGCFRRDALIEAGGYQSGSIGEDMELVVRLHRKWLEKPAYYRIVFVPEPVCWTEVPEDWRSLRNQRNRWQRGTVDAIQRHRGMCLRPSYGAVGMLAIPYLILFEMFGPAVELLGYVFIAVGLLANLTTAETVTLYLIVSLLFGILLSMLAVLLDDFTVRRYPSWRDTARLFAGAILENFGHRQMLTLVRAKGLWDGLRGMGGWGHIQRKGF
jgi:cellulose synthase/poly-beta-1,6-N-acetylglucosamine synthase-like glycosyltransferase